MAFCVSKIKGKLIFKDLGGWQTRNASTFWCIQQADLKHNWGDFKEITIHTGDFENNNSHYTYSKKDGYNNLVPDFNFHAWPQAGINDYEKFVEEIANAGLNKYEINKVAWIGSSSTHSNRKILLEIGNNNNAYFDFFDMRWLPSGNVFPNTTKYISTPDLVKKYSMLIDIEGVGYSGRVKHLLWSHRPLLIVDRPHKEFFYESLKEWEHYIPVKRDMSDLVEKTKWCLDNYDKALIIAENAFQFSKLYLSRDACYDKWNDIICRLDQA
jgi:hypothetical protein